MSVAKLALSRKDKVYKRMPIWEKVQSRKFLVTIAVGFIVVFGNALDLDITTEKLWQLITVAAPYLGVQGILDFKNGK